MIFIIRITDAGNDNSLFTTLKESMQGSIDISSAILLRNIIPEYQQWHLKNHLYSIFTYSTYPTVHYSFSNFLKALPSKNTTFL